MADFIIPLLPDSLHFDLSLDLSGREYRLEFKWSVRESSWYVRIFTDTDDHLYSAKLVGVPIGHRRVDPRMPPGYLLATDSTEKTSNPPGPKRLRRGSGAVG